MRLDKLIEARLGTSRRETKYLLKSRQVLINDQIELSGRRNVDSGLHRIEVLGRGMLMTDHAYYLLHKPQGVVTAVRDAVKPTVLDLLAKEDRREQLYPVGRLDGDTEGLVFLTDNGPLGYTLMQAKFSVAKIYEVRVNGAVDQEDVAAFLTGIRFLDGTVCQVALLKIITSSPVLSHVHLTITEGKFHQVKKMFLARGKKVIYLKRLQLGPLKLPNDLKLGTYRCLSQSELQSLLPFFGGS